MSSRDSRAEYERRMHRVLEHIDQHLDKPLDLDVLAEVALFSPYHFHRLFSAWMGETLGDYLRRRRLEVAAMRLAAQPRLSIMEVSLSVGFGSAEAFARAFKTHFKYSPTSWRMQQAEHRLTYREVLMPREAGCRERLKNSNPSQANRKISQTPKTTSWKHGVSHNLQPETSMNVQLIDRQPATVAYLRHVGPYGEPVSLFWQETVYPWMVANHLLDHPRYGISHDDPSITAPQKCRYDAGVEVPSQLVTSGKAHRTIVPGGRYAVLGFKGTAEQAPGAWAALLRDWLPSSGLQLDARPSFEYYPRDATYDSKTGVFSCEICIPVAPL